MSQQGSETCQNRAGTVESQRGLFQGEDAPTDMGTAFHAAQLARIEQALHRLLPVTPAILDGESTELRTAATDPRESPPQSGRSGMESVAPPDAEAFPHDQLAEAMGYAVLGGGKRLRALLVLAACTDYGGDTAKAMSAALAIELIHAYSLVHDDLPAMDNDKWRRGRPTCHRVWDDATAILAGDALQSLAFEILAADEDLTPSLRVRLIHHLAVASGLAGMAGGQMIDLLAPGRILTEQALAEMHQKKTGALIQFSLISGARIGSPELTEAEMSKLEKLAAALGLAYQIRDDINDVEGSTETLGKTAGKDAADGKTTYTTLYGVTGAREKLDQASGKILNALNALSIPAPLLRSLCARYVCRSS